MLCRTLEGCFLSEPFWYLGKALCYGWGWQFTFYSLTLAQMEGWHYLFCRTWVVLAIYEPLCCLGKAFFLEKVRTLLLPGVAGYPFYSPCAEGTSICWLSKYDRQFHLIIPKEAQGWAVRRPSLSIEQPNIEHSLNSTWPWSATNMGLLAIRAERGTSTVVILWIFGCRLTAAQSALASGCEGFAQFTQPLYKLKILLTFKSGSRRTSFNYPYCYKP